MTRFEKFFVWGSTAAVSASGFGYAAVKYLMQPGDPYAVVNHPLQPVLLKLHVLTAPIFVFAVGLIAMRHIWPHFRAGIRRGRRSGLSAALVLLPMVASGYLIQTVTHIGWLQTLVVVHLITGTVFATGAAAHKLATKGRNAQERARPDRERDPRRNPEAKRTPLGRSAA